MMVVVVVVVMVVVMVVVRMVMVVVMMMMKINCKSKLKHGFPPQFFLVFITFKDN
jgi:hypothetical protein